MLDDAVFVDDEGGTGADGAQPDQVRQEGAVLFADFLVQVAEERELDVLLFGPGFLGEGRIYADAVDGRVQLLVGGETGGDVAHLLGADAGEGEGKEEQNGLFLSKVVGKFDVLGVAPAFGLEEIK